MELDFRPRQQLRRREVQRCRNAHNRLERSQFFPALKISNVVEAEVRLLRQFLLRQRLGFTFSSDGRPKCFLKSGGSDGHTARVSKYPMRLNQPQMVLTAVSIDSPRAERAPSGHEDFRLAYSRRRFCRIAD